VTGNISLSSSNFTYTGPGRYTYSHGVRAMERLNFSVTLNGAPVGSSVLLNITTMLPEAVDSSRSMASAAVQRDGEVARNTWSTSSPPMALTAHSWHLLFVPVFAAGRPVAVFRDPQLGARLTVAVPVTATAPTNASNATGSAATEQQVFPGYWSSSNGSYVIPFKLPVLGNVSGIVTLLSNSSSNTTLVSGSQD